MHQGDTEIIINKSVGSAVSCVSRCRYCTVLSSAVDTYLDVIRMGIDSRGRY